MIINSRILFDRNIIMRVVFLLSVLVGSVINGSGPYAPRGWKPVGPAFTLPGEEELTQVVKRLEVTSGSPEAGFKEYGPPVLNQLKQNQQLPEAQTVKTFEQQRVQNVDDKIEEKPDASINSVEETTATETANLDLTTLALGNINEDSSAEILKDQTDEEPAKSQPVKITETQISNMADLLHMISEQNKQNLSVELGEKKEENSGSLEGFREYGPPGFTKYNPPDEPHHKFLAPSETKLEPEDIRKRRAPVRFNHY